MRLAARAGLVVVMLIASACGGDDAGERDGDAVSSTTATTEASVVARTDTSATVAPPGAIRVELICCEYAPATLAADASATFFLVNLQTDDDLNDVVRAVDLQHDLAIVGPDGLTIAKSERLGIGERATFTLEGLPPGSHDFYCTVRGHAAQGMRGTLQISA